MRIIACGDIALCSGVEQKVHSNEAGMAQDLQIILRKAELFLANVECPLTDHNRPQWSYFPTLKGSKTAGRLLRDLGVGAASLANNHIADYGQEGLADTIAVLEEQGIPWLGAGWTSEKASRPLIIERDGLRIGILALAQPEIAAAKNGKWGAAVLDGKKAIDLMQDLKGETDFAVAYLHFGVEFFEYPTPDQIRLSRNLIDAGASLVLGHHPHIAQGYEYYRNGFIAYSLGNFIFDMDAGHNPTPRLGLLIQAEIDRGALKQVEIIPVETAGGVPRKLQGKDKEMALEHLREISGVLRDNKELCRRYYFICRDNFDMHLKAIIRLGLKKGNFRRCKDLVLEQFWPQIYALRLSLLRFLLSGEALRFERQKTNRPQGLAPNIWRGICWISKAVGFGWSRFLRRDCLLSERSG